MGFLLLQYEFQRANREVNLCNRKTVRINNQLTRATKRIEKMESVFSKEKTALETDWNNRKSTMTQGLSQMAITITNTCGGDPTTAAGMFQTQMNNIVIAGVPLSSLVSIPSSALDVSSAGGDTSKINQIIMSAINSAVGQAQQMINTLVEQAKSIDEATLEAKQDAQLQPLSEKESDIQAEQSLNDTLSTLWEQRRDSAKEKLPQAIENSTGHFGLK